MHKPWTETDELALEQFFRQGVSDGELEPIFDRTANAIGCKRREMGFVRWTKWTDEEDGTIRENWATMTSAEIADLLPGRSEAQVAKRGWQMGLKRRIKNV